MNINSLETPPAQWHVRTTVLALHMLFILLIWWGGYESQIKRTPQKLTVHTVTLAPRPAPRPVSRPVTPAVAEIEVEALPQPIVEEVPAPPPVPAPDQPKKIEPKPIEQKQAEPKKVEPKKPAAAKPQKKPTPVKKPVEKAPDTKQSALVADALSSLDRFSKRAKAPTNAKKAASVTTLATLSLDSPLIIEDGEPSMSPQEKSYHDELVQRLKLQLKLPEHGEVQVDLTISRLGRVTCIKCTKFKSAKNATYLEKKLKSLQFPPFGSHFPNVQEQTFHLQLRSDINY